MGLMDDAKRAAKRSAELAEMSDAQRVDRLRSELVASDTIGNNLQGEIKILVGKLGVACAEIETLRKRVAELEADKVRFRERLDEFEQDHKDERTRAERAEKYIVELEAEAKLAADNMRAMDDSLDAKIRHVISRLRDERGLGSRTLLAQEAAALIEQLDAMRLIAAHDHSQGGED